MRIPFEPTRSYVYRATRYEILPRLEQMAEPFGSKPFLLRELSKQLLEEIYTPVQLEIPIKKAQSDKIDKIKNIFGFYIPFLAQNLRIFEKVGNGYFKNISLEEEVAEADEIAFDIDSDEAGCIYAYSFPTLKKENGRFPVKIGLTTSGDPENRVNSQCRQTCCFEHPTILGSWRVDRVAAFESAIHSTLEARGLRREAPGSEWFDTTLEEIQTIIQFIQTNP